MKGQTKEGVDETCEADPSTGVLQDQNLALSTSAEQLATRAAIAQSRCIDQANAAAPGVSVAQGASSCIVATSATLSDVLAAPTVTTEQATNDAMGDGEKMPCKEISWFYHPVASASSYVILAIVLAFVGFAAAWVSVCCYNRIKARQAALKETSFEGTTVWRNPVNDRTAI